VWAQLACTALGVWLMAAPQVLGYHGAARTNDHVVGPLVATFACVAAWEATRSVRWVNLPLGAWLVLAPWVLGGGWFEAAHGTAAGLAVAALALARGETRQKLGGGWSAVWNGERRAGEGAS
jgi:hypothetical protein